MVTFNNNLVWLEFQLQEDKNDILTKTFEIIKTVKIAVFLVRGVRFYLRWDFLLLFQTIFSSNSFLSSKLVLERADRLAGETGFVIVSDTNGAGLANVDLEMNKFNNAILAHYPLALKAMYIVDLSWVLSSLMKLMMTFVDPRLPVHFVAASELSRYIDPEFIPSGLGDGARLKRSFPSCLRRLDHCYQDHGLEETFVNHFYKVYKLKRSESEPKVEGVDENEVAVKG